MAEDVVTDDGWLQVPLNFYCTNCNKLQPIAHVMAKGTTFCCHNDCNDFKRFYQTKVYFVRLSQIQIKPAVDTDSEFELQPDSQWHDIYHTMQIIYEGQANDVEIRKAVNDKEEKEDVNVFQVADVWIASHAVIPKYIHFEIKEFKKGHGAKRTYKAMLTNVQPRYYREDGEQTGDFTIGIMLEKEEVGQLSADICVIGVSPQIFRYHGFLHLNKHEKETANWYMSKYESDQDEVAAERTNVTADEVAGERTNLTATSHQVQAVDASAGQVSAEVESGKMLHWIYSNKEVLRQIAQKLKDAEHEWSANDFSNVNELSIKQSEMARWFDEFRRYFTENKHSFLLLDINGNGNNNNNDDAAHLFEIKQEVEQQYLLQMAASQCFFELHNVNDAICLMVRYQYLTNTLFSGFDDEFNIYRSYCFDRRTEYKSLKLVLSAFTLMLQITMTIAMYYEVSSAWKEKKWRLHSASGSFIFAAAVVLFFYSSYLTNITVQKTYKWYLYFSRICYVSVVIVMFDFISNILIPIAIAAISFFWLSFSESLADIVLNSFALLFVYYLDDVVNTFEKDEDVLLKEDMTLFVAALNKSQSKTVVRTVENSGFSKLWKSFLWEVLLAFPMNLYHLVLFVCFLPRYASRREHS